MDFFSNADNGAQALQAARAYLKSSESACGDAFFESRLAAAVRWDSPAATRFRDWLTQLTRDIATQQSALENQLRGLHG